MAISIVPHRNPNTRDCCIVIFLILAALTGCTNPTSSASQPEDVFLTPEPKLTFFVAAPPDTPPDAEIYLDIVDEITGVNLNPARHKMSLVSENLYFFELPAQNHTLLKYRYALGSSPTIIERSTTGSPVFYRTFAIQPNGPNVVRDAIVSWSDAPINVSLGRLEGILTNETSGTGIPDVLVNINGLQAVTDSDGAFHLSNVYPGKYLLTIISLDNRYGPYQQEAIIAPEASTPVELALQAQPTVEITFALTPPPNHDPSVPIRLVGNTQSLGSAPTNRLSDSSIIPVKAPVLIPRDDGTYSLTLTLPAGMDLRYKYTLGNGFWNAERQADGQFITRRIIVPEEDTTVQDSVASWVAGDRSPITIQVSSKGDDDLPEQIFIQLNSYTWTEPLPMWKADDDQWTYQIHSPLYLFPSIGYRVCWDAQCNTVIQLDDPPISEPPRIPTDGSTPVIHHILSSRPDASNE